MKKKLGFFSSLWLFPLLSLVAQEAPVLTIERVQALAVENAESYRRQVLDQDIQDAKLREAKARLYPQVTAGVDIRYNTQLPTNILPGAIFGRPGEDGIPVQFGTKWNNFANLEIEQFVFDAQVLGDLELIRLNRQVSEAGAEATASDIRLEATRRYLEVLLNRAQAAELEASALRQKNTMAEVEAKVGGGQLNAIESERVRTDYEVTLADLARAGYAVRLSEIRLKSLLGLDLQAKVVLQDSLPPLPSVAGPMALEGIIPTMPAYRQQALQVALAEREIGKQEKAVLPTVTFYGLLGAQALGNRLNYFDTNVLPWYSQSYLGVRAKWNINRLFDNRYSLDRLELQRRQASTDLQGRSEALRLAVEQARVNFLQAREDLRVREQRRSFAQSERSYLATRFRGDLATAKELTDAERAELVAERGYLVAYFNCLLAYYEWEKAVGGL